jgi:hypothetical protein
VKRFGRPRTSKLTRAEQLRHAKRAQRDRDRAAGVMQVQLKLPRPVAAKLSVTTRIPGFAQALDAFLDELVVRLADYPALSDLAWNRTDEYLLAREAFGLYERNWRFVEPGRLDERERALIERLAQRFGAGMIHA